MGVSRAHAVITSDPGVHDLADDVLQPEEEGLRGDYNRREAVQASSTRSKRGRHLVGDTDHEAVLRAVVLVFVLDDKTLAGLVISLALTPPAILNLVPLVVRRGLQDLDVTHDSCTMQNGQHSSGGTRREHGRAGCGRCEGSVCGQGAP